MIIQHNEDLAFFGIRFINHFEEVDKVGALVTFADQTVYFACT